MLFMRVYEYYNSMQLGLPFNTVISNYLVDLKVIFASHVEGLLLLGGGRHQVQRKDQAIRSPLVERLQEVELVRFSLSMARFIINEVLEGNLLTPARLDEVMKRTKFIKRILNFFMPSKQQFINMEWVGLALDSV